MKIRQLSALLLAALLSLFLLSPLCFADPADGSAADPAQEGDELPVSAVYDPNTGYPLQERISIRARQALICSLDSDTIVYSYHIDEKLYPASLAKIMTCLVAYELAPLDTPITVGSDVLWDVGDGGTAELCVGEVLSLKDMLYCAMLTSGNDACNAIAQNLCGSSEAFVQKLNEKARELGCTGTHFANTHGLHDWEEYTTARDLMTMTKEALKHPELEEIFYTVEYRLPETQYHDSRLLITSNYLVTDAQTPKYYYAAARGIKSGFTSVAGCSVITTGEVDGMRVLVIAASAPSEEELNGEISMYSFPSAKTLLQYAFNNFKYCTVLNPDIPIASLDVSGGESGAVIVAPTRSVGMIVPRKYDTKKLEVTVTPLSGASVPAPFAAEDVIGTASVSYQGTVIASCSVAPLNGVAAAVIEERDPGFELLEPEEDFSVWKILSIALLCLIGLYVLLYLFRNLRRRKKHAARNAAERPAAARPTLSRRLHRLRRRLFRKKRRVRKKHAAARTVRKE